MEQKFNKGEKNNKNIDETRNHSLKKWTKLRKCCLECPRKRKDTNYQKQEWKVGHHSDHKEIKRTPREHSKQFYAKILDNFNETDRFLEGHKWPNLTQE